MAYSKEPIVSIDCPFCGGHVTRCEITSSAGKRAFSACCDMPIELIDNYDDVFAGLPERLQQVAITKAKAKQAVIVEREKENARRFKENQERINARYAHLMKGERRYAS